MRAYPGYPTSGYSAPSGHQPSGYGVPPGYEIRRKKPVYKRVWFWLVVIVLAIIVAVVASIASAVNNAVNRAHRVVYKVTGSGKADIQYFESNGSGNSNRSKSISHQSLPWSRTFQIKGDLSSFLVSATSSNLLAKEHLHCTLSVDGKVVSRDDATGRGAAVSCDGTG